MTLATQTPRVVITGNGTRGPYSVVDSNSQAIRLTATSHLKLTRYATATDDNDTGTLLVENTDYTVGGTADARTFTLASSQDVLSSAQRIVAERVQSYSQDLSLTNGGAFSASALMARLDKMEEHAQESKAQISRAVMLQFADATERVALPSPPTTSTVALGRDTSGALVHLTPADFTSDVLLGDLWSVGLAKDANSFSPVSAVLYGFKVGGGNADATANTTALQAALDANYWVTLPEGTAYINKITHTRSNRLSGAGQIASILVRANSLNDYAIYASAKDDMIYENFTLDQNRSNNTGSGSHTGIRLEGGCNRWRLRGVKVIGARGTFSGSPVGAGFSSVGGGSRGVLDHCWFDDCYDGYVISAHTDARDNGSRLTACLRNGGLVASSSHRFEHHGVEATGNSTTYAGAGLQIIDTNDAKGYGGRFASNTLGHGLQHNGSDRCEVHGGTFSSNGISGLDFYDSIDGKVYGGYSESNTVRGIEIDSASNGCTVTTFQAVSNGDVDISVFRSADVQLIGCEGNVRGWDSGSISTATVSAGGTGYVVGDVLTLAGGTKGTAATFTVATLSGSAVATVTVSNAGNIWTFPSEPASVTGGTGTGATFNFVGLAEASSTVARLQIMGGHRSDTLNFVTDACTEIRLTDVKATTITDASDEIVSAVGCDNLSTIFALADVPTYADQAAAATGITGVGRLFRFNTTGALGITLT